ncbi:hypothetical protein M231_06088 [Tremella mesenterica]|uniref:Uncharacterized protein n=1 Tax=Tremella mesenterica TaxID=5217 RepID=A0A4Q1BFH0_TREME|nr:hypothetical protein M231_06088 [Tremella mesenterica]
MASEATQLEISASANELFARANELSASAYESLALADYHSALAREYSALANENLALANESEAGANRHENTLKILVASRHRRGQYIYIVELTIIFGIERVEQASDDQVVRFSKSRRNVWMGSVQGLDRVAQIMDQAGVTGPYQAELEISFPSTQVEGQTAPSHTSFTVGEM